MEPELNRNNATLAWIAAAVFAVIAIVLFIMLVSGDDSRDLSDVREQIRTDCAGADEQSRANCAGALTQLEEILLDVRSDIELPEEPPETQADAAPVQ